MKRLTLAALLLLTTMVAAQTLTNPGFETGTTAGWSFNGSGSVSVTTSSPHRGLYSAVLRDASGQHPALYAVDSSGNRFFAVQPGDVITFGGWARRVSGDGKGRWKLAVYDANKANATYPNPSPANVWSSSWAQELGTYTIPTGKAYVSFYAELYANTTKASVAFDDAIFSRQTPTPPPPPPPPSVSVSISPTSATLTSGATQQFTASVQNTSNTAVSWGSSLCCVNTNGFFTAPSVTTQATGTVTATSQADPTKSASASVTVNPASVQHKVSLSATASTTPSVTYCVYRTTVSGSYTQAPWCNLPTPSYSDSTVQSNTTYYYAMTAVDSSSNQSQKSNQVTAVIPQ